MKEESACQPDHGHDGLHDGPDLKCLFDGHVVVFLEHPEADVVEVRKHQAAGGSCDDKQLRRHPGVRHQGHDDPGGRDCRHGGRAHGQPHQRGRSPGEQDGGEVCMGGDVLDGVPRSAIDQNLFERSTRGDNQDHHRDAGGRGSDALHEGVHAAAPPQSERVERHQNREQKRHVGIAQKLRGG
jgi:hypothetical protein